MSFLENKMLLLGDRSIRVAWIYLNGTLEPGRLTAFLNYPSKFIYLVNFRCLFRMALTLSLFAKSCDRLE